VVKPDGLAGLFFGSPRETGSGASALSSKRHISLGLDRPMKQVLS